MTGDDRRYSVALVGINAESLAIAATLERVRNANVVRILNPGIEDIQQLRAVDGLDFIIDASNDARVAAGLRRLRDEHTEILSSCSARLLLNAQPPASEGTMDRVLDSMRGMREAAQLTRHKDETLKVVLTLAMQALHADAGSIMLLDGRKRNLRIEAAVGLPGELVRTVTQKVGAGIAGTVAKTRRPLLIQGRADSSRVSVLITRSDVVSSLCCPILLDEELIGVINVCSKRSERRFDDRDMDDLRRYAGFTADIINTSWQFEASTSERFSQSTLSSVRDILSLRYRLDERLNLVLLKLANTFNAQSCEYFEYNESCRSFFAKGASSFNPDLMKGKVIPFEHPLASDVIAYNRAATSIADAPAGAGRIWQAAQPINCEDKLTGLLFVSFPSEKKAIREELHILAKTAVMLGKEIAEHREMQTAKMQAVRYSAISEFSFDIAETRTFPELVRKTLSNASLILDAETAVFRLYRDNTRRLEVFDTLSLRSGFTVPEIETLDFEVTNDAAAREEPLLVPTIEHSPYAVFGQGFSSALSIAFRRGNRLLATLSLYDKKAPDQNGAPAFDEHDREVFATFAYQVRKALMRFFGARPGAETDARRRAGAPAAPARPAPVRPMRSEETA
jgi:transcriptional regulator with GAF, ATPase, and Fis domain